MVRPEVHTFRNGEACTGVGIVGDASVSHDVINISGRYPEEGSWARNREAREQVIVVRGVGSVAIRGIGEFFLDAETTDNRAVVVDPGKWFAWDGSMTISMVCQPGFDPDKYEVKRESDIEKEKSHE